MAFLVNSEAFVAIYKSCDLPRWYGKRSLSITLGERRVSLADPKFGS